MKFIEHSRRRHQGFSAQAASALSGSSGLGDKTVLVAVVAVFLWLLTDSLPAIASWISSAVLR